MEHDKGLNGQQIGEANVKKLKLWSDSLKSQLVSKDETVKEQAAETLSAYIRAGIINRSKLRKELSFSRSSFGSNKSLMLVLTEFEDFLREREYLPELTDDGHKKAKGEAPTKRDTTSLKASLSEKRVASLEVENMQLRTQINELQNGMENLKELAEVLSELGVIKQ